MVPREYADYGMQCVTQFIDAVDKRMEELGREAITRSELHVIARTMREEYRKRVRELDE